MLCPLRKVLPIMELCDRLLAGMSDVALFEAVAERLDDVEQHAYGDALRHEFFEGALFEDEEVTVLHCNDGCAPLFAGNERHFPEHVAGLEFCDDFLAVIDANESAEHDIHLVAGGVFVKNDVPFFDVHGEASRENFSHIVAAESVE